jgi:hypothetical protein
MRFYSKNFNNGSELDFIFSSNKIKINDSLEKDKTSAYTNSYIIKKEFLYAKHV